MVVGQVARWLLCLDWLKLRTRLGLLNCTLRSSLDLPRIICGSIIMLYAILVVINMIDVVLKMLIYYDCNWTHAFNTFIVSHAILICLPQDLVNIVIWVASSPTHGVSVIFNLVSVSIFRWIKSQLLAWYYHSPAFLRILCIICLWWVNIFHLNRISLQYLYSVFVSFKSLGPVQLLSCPTKVQGSVRCW